MGLRSAIPASPPTTDLEGRVAMLVTATGSCESYRFCSKLGVRPDHVRRESAKYREERTNSVRPGDERCEAFPARTSREVPSAPLTSVSEIACLSSRPRTPSG